MEAEFPNCGHRISIVGTSGSGKTTLAKNISQQLQIPHIELDSLHWEPNWTEATDQVFRDRISTSLKGDRWIVDGNYSKVRDLVWSRADTVVFLDYPFLTVLGQLLRRTIKRSFKQEELWSGNRESIHKAFFSQDSILVWMLKTYSKNRRKYPALLQQSEYKHLSFVHLRSPKITEQWLMSVIG